MKNNGEARIEKLLKQKRYPTERSINSNCEAVND